MSLLSMCLGWLHLPHMDVHVSHCRPVVDGPFMIVPTTRPCESSGAKCPTSGIRICTATELKPIRSETARRDPAFARLPPPGSRSRRA